ncbi:Exo-alpha-sialidase [Madurella mycetomatis]|uniref:Exo-alpha-sialidase n=1 Tax=Madurella mycetomatis TaxID=100816 RepID=A0A175VU74_9PEZI|nr:Exo-alpha-sialidase [Madurella mycetomatis]
MRWLRGGTLLGLTLPPGRAAVDDPAGDTIPYHKEFVLFRCSNMASPDKLPSSVGFILRTSPGRKLASAEGRRHTNQDFGDINLFMSRNEGDYSHNGNDAPTDGSITKKIDSTGKVGDIYTCLIPLDPGIGIKLTSSGLVVPTRRCSIIGRGTPDNRTWSLQLLPDGGSEGTIAQTPDSRLYRNDRPGGNGDYPRVARGTLASFGAFADDTGLPNPRCEGSVFFYNQADSGPTQTIFMNSASKDSLRAMRVRISYDRDTAK